ncbi:putative activating signal cointegrator 1 complex subunit 3 family 1 ASCC3L1, partial [Toxoplasma gondii RUB]
MAEEFERFKRFEYRQNSNLVLQRDTSTGVAPAVHLGEPTGEPESLAGRKLYPMGDKVERGLKKEDRPVKNDSKRAKLKRNKLDLKRGATVLDADVTEIFFYKPTTQQTRLVYEQLLVTLQQQLGDQPDEVLKGAADEVLAALKADGCRESEKKKNVEQVLGPVNSDVFTRLHQLAKNITDYSLGGEEEDGAQAG